VFINTGDQGRGATGSLAGALAQPANVHRNKA